MTYSIIPSEKNFAQTDRLIQTYGVTLEYNDFFQPSVYDSEEETDRLIAFYTSVKRDRSTDTLHGAFLGLDITAADTVIRERSRRLFRYSAGVAKRLGIRGVVFHSGLIGGLGKSYEENWLAQATAFFRELCGEFPEVEIYLENTFEQEPFLFARAAKLLSDVPNFGLCLDYAHAVLTKTPADVWCRELAPYIRHMHINDNDLKSDLHLAVGDGKIDFSELAFLLEKYNIRTSVLIEITDTDKAERSLKKLKAIVPSTQEPEASAARDSAMPAKTNASTARDSAISAGTNASMTRDRAISAGTNASAARDSAISAGANTATPCPECTSPDFSTSGQDILGQILDIGIALTAENDPDKLLAYIVDTAMSLTQSDGGTLYILENAALTFHIMKTRSKQISLGENGEKINLPPVPLKKENICAYSVLTGKTLNIPDVYNSAEFDFSGPKTYDAMNNYHTQSMVVIPLINKENEAIGVLQLINAQTDGKIRPFTAGEERMIHSLGSQASIALSNLNYTRELKEQLWSFTEAMTQAIDERTPYNASHTRKVAEYTELLARHINQLHDEGKEEHSFDEEHLDCLKMAALLHDIGKLVIPKSIMNKATRLGFGFEPLMNRFQWIKAKAEIAYLKGSISKEEFETVSEQAATCLSIVPAANAAGRLDDALRDKLNEIFQYSFTCDGETINFFDAGERERLSIVKGTLTEEERHEMEEHVVKTDVILSKVHFNSHFKNVRTWAAQHHECLDGSGYPRKLAGGELCLEARILAVADICDALLATDRPYKKALTMEETFKIMHSMSAEEKIDETLVGYLEHCLTEKR